MNEKTVRALIAAGAIKNVRIIANGSTIYVELDTVNGSFSAETVKGKLKTWSSVNTAAKWVHSLGIGQALLDVSRWQPRQTGFRV